MSRNLTRTRIIGVSACMRSFDFFFGVVLDELQLRHSDNLSRTLQATHMSAAQGQKVAEMTKKTLQSVTSEENFRLFWAKVVRISGDLGVDDPV